MDVDGFLNIERRTGVKNEDIDDFARKADDVQKAIRDMMEGKINPEDIKIDGIESPEEVALKEKQRQERLAKQAKEKEELRLKRLAEEKERWWYGAEVYKDNREFEETSNLGVDELESRCKAKAKVANRYNFDYSKWDQWVPNDEATEAENAEQKAKEEAERNAEFEKNNPEFVNQFMTDMEERKKSTAKKQESADILRIKGNNQFKVKKYEKALELYMDALKVTPYDVKILTNIAQASIKLKDNESALEFLSRTLYLDARHVKALSRKAFILSEQGKQAEAEESISRALAIDPMNKELLALQKEIRIITMEALQEQQVVAEKGAAAANVTDSSAEHTSESKETLSSDVEHVAPVAQSSISSVVEPQVNSGMILSEADAMKSVDRLLKLLTTRVGGSATAECKEMNAAQEACRELALYFHLPNDGDAAATATSKLGELTKVKIYARTSGLLAAAIDCAKDLIENVTSAAKSDAAILSKAFALVSDMLAVISQMCNGQRAAQLVIVETKLIAALKTLLTCESASDDIVLSVIHLLRFISKDDICPKAQLAVLTDKTLLSQLGRAIGNKSFGLTASLKASSFLENMNKVAIISKAAEILSSSSFHESGKVCMSNNATEMGPSVCALSTALYQITLGKSLLKEATSLRDEALQAVIAALMGFSQLEPLRSFFSIHVPVCEPSVAVSDVVAATAKSKSSSTSKEVTASAISSVLLAMKSSPSDASNCLAILMNVCCIEVGGSGGEGSVSSLSRQAVVEEGGLAVLMQYMSLDEAKRAREDGPALVRAAGLLSRVATTPKAQRELIVDRNYRMLCKRIGHKFDQPVSSWEKWEVDERGHYVRVMASITLTTVRQVAIGLEENVVAALLSLLPQPRTDAGVITARSVTLMPHEPVAVTMSGNVCRCLVPYADQPGGAAALYTETKLLGVEKLICVMASCTDIRVRKNVAILLAKGCRIPAVREKVTELRGMQMIVELQNSF